MTTRIGPYLVSAGIILSALVPTSNLSTIAETTINMSAEVSTRSAGTHPVNPVSGPGSSSVDRPWINLFDGRHGQGSLDGWKQSGPGSFRMDEDGTIRSDGGMGLFYYAEQQFEDFELEVEWKVENPKTNSGIFVRFPDGSDPWLAVESGYEIQIDETNPGVRQTGAVYSFAAPTADNSKPVGEWNRFLIKVRGQHYQVRLNGKLVTEFAGQRSTHGHVGLQNHDPESVVWFRSIRVRPIEPDPNQLQRLANAFAVTAIDDIEPIKVLTVTATHGYRHTAAIEAARNILGELSKTTEFQFDFTEDLADFNDKTLSNYDLIFFANSTLRVDEPTPDAQPQDGVITFRPGDWKNFNAAIKTPERDLNGKVALSGAPPNLTGMVKFDTGTSIIDDIEETSNGLIMRWNAGEGIGPVVATISFESPGFTGELRVGPEGELKLPLEGSTVATAQQNNWIVADPVTATHRAAISKFVKNGGGIAVAHAGLDAFYGWGEYRRMVGGGLFASHPWTQPVEVTIEAPQNPAVSHMGDALHIRDEIYVLDKNPRWTSTVLASLDTASVGIEQGPADSARNDFPISWLREHNGSKIFVTKLGHFPDVWSDPAFVQHLLQGMRQAAGRIPGSFASHRIKEIIVDDVWPDDLAVDERGNVWIVELRGKIHRYDAMTESSALLGTLATTDPTKIEHGLLGIEIDPDFYSGSPYVYLFFTQNDTYINTLSRYRYEDGELDLSNGEVLLRVPTEPQCCHQAGDLEWGLDGTLYISTGDTGMSETRPGWEISEGALEDYKAGENLKDVHWSRLVDSERSAQNLQDLRGKILRINKDGSIPADNPFVGTPGVRWEIYAYGLRNPYRFKVHPQSGDVLIGVVGPDARYDYDEYNISANGGENFGWPRSIGKLFYNNWEPRDIPNYTPPMWEYTYATGARSASMGPVYEHPASGGFPKIFAGKVFVYDWSRRWIKWADLEPSAFTNDPAEDVRNERLEVEIPATRLTNIRDFDQFTNTTPISMELGPDGNLYVAEFDGFWDAGPNSKVSRYRWSYGPETSETNTQALPILELGETLYQTRCASCHQGNGEGIAGVFPTLVDTDWVLGDKEKLIDTVLNGTSGEIEVNGQLYTGTMPGWANSLSNPELASLLTYIRTTWGNTASRITADEIQAQR